MAEIGMVFDDYTVRQIMLGNCWRTYRLISKGKKPMCVPGDIIYVGEAWQEIPRDDKDDREEIVAYRADNNDVTQTWVSGRWMPRYLSRINLIVSNVYLLRLHKANLREYEQPGIRYDIMERDQQELLFRLSWDKQNAGRGFPYDSNPLVWCYEWEQIVIDGEVREMREKVTL